MRLAIANNRARYDKAIRRTENGSKRRMKAGDVVGGRLRGLALNFAASSSGDEGR